ncbi:MAG: HD-GYP domain-containing protein [Tepidisphaeraceae bacterium]|jgi:HD-GYP domain-containing protein (c-di-GMP phosphodiesterase class II)
MTLQLNQRADSSGHEPSLIPAAVLDSLAARFRPNGLFVALLRPDGSVVWHDPQAGMFFQRFVLPLLQYGDPADGNAKLNICGVAPGSIAVNADLPGVLLAAVGYGQRRQTNAVIVLAAKASTFKLSEDVVRVCSRLGLDGIWLSQAADELPTYLEEMIQRHARMLLAMIRDQMRLENLQGELDSLSGQLSDTYEELSLVYQISSGMRINRRANDFFKQVCLDVLEVMGVEGMGVALIGEHSASQEPVLYGPLGLPPGTVHRLADELLPILCARKTPLLLNQLAQDKNFAWLSEHARQILAVPLLRQDQVLGCLFSLNKIQGEFDSQDSKLLNSIANESAIYLENALLFDDVHGLMMGLLHSLTSAVDAKDAYTCGHSERVAMLAKQLTLEAGLPEALAERVYMAGLLHDVGKIGVPESVLQKTGRLTPDEFEKMKKHPEIGARILKDIKQINDLLPGVLHHHERFDGQGYPAGLTSDNIPLMGRIICLADCFDAMTSNRTYRKALPLEVALMEIRRCSGTQFDPVLTESFLRIGAEKFREMLRAHHDQMRETTTGERELCVA